MFTSARCRRFAPLLDCLDSRLALSGTGAMITPMDPVLLGGTDLPPIEVGVTPMDPVLLGLACDPAGDVPAWVSSAVAMGDGLILF